MLTGLAHVAVRVADLDKSLEFYCKTLGFKEKYRINREDGSAWLVQVEVGPMQFIELFSGAQAPFSFPAGAGYVHICLEADDIHKTFQELSVRGMVPTNGEPMLGLDNAWQFWTSDPDGNPIEFQQYRPDSMENVGNLNNVVFKEG